MRSLVVVERCDECGYEYHLGRSSDAGPAIVEGARQLAAVLEDPRLDVRSRRQPDIWSPLEYGCHLRDVLLVQRERVLLARRAQGPRLETMGRDERADHDGYRDQDPSSVARQLCDAAHMFGNVLARLDPSDWERTVIYNYPSPSPRSLRWVAVHTLHEVQHHRLDVDKQIA